MSSSTGAAPPASVSLMYSKEMEKVVIFSDGASKGNPGPGGWGAVVVSGEQVVEVGGYEKLTTNNRMELRAAIEGLNAVRSKDAKQTILYTDSSYVINGITKWVHGWKKNGWRTKDKKPVINQDLWMSLDAAVAGHGRDIEWTYVGGHVGVVGNERVDRIASDYAEGKKVDLYYGPLAEYPIDIANLGADSDLQKSKSASNERSKAKAYSYISRVDGKVMVHKTWKECEERVRGKTARFKKALSPEEEKDIVAEFSKH
jgi:ribonuclease HI